MAPEQHADSTAAETVRFDVLHALKVKGFAPARSIASTIGVPESAVDDVLSDLAAADLAGFRDGRISGWRLTAAGTAVHAEALERHPADHSALRRLHDWFTPLNGRVKELCTAWQLRDGTTNDHADEHYDATVIADAAALHLDVDRMLVGASNVFTRTSWYRPRLQAAHHRFVNGDGDALARPLSDSYHDVWMELHHDLIVTLGLTRTDADS